jgi:hypothetical protein
MKFNYVEKLPEIIEDNLSLITDVVNVAQKDTISKDRTIVMRIDLEDTRLIQNLSKDMPFKDLYLVANAKDLRIAYIVLYSLPYFKTNIFLPDIQVDLATGTCYKTLVTDTEIYLAAIVFTDKTCCINYFEDTDYVIKHNTVRRLFSNIYLTELQKEHITANDWDYEETD